MYVIVHLLHDDYNGVRTALLAVCSPPKAVVGRQSVPQSDIVNQRPTANGERQLLVPGARHLEYNVPLDPGSGIQIQAAIWSHAVLTGGRPCRVKPTNPRSQIASPGPNSTRL
jgi:hypothetical protein